ncbi:cell division protein FtsK [Nocardiopsis tropica]|uniref:Cell division protein FtsK n=1 Tax=Nocardiopsis tropica TaxID=109330 RepID=A0ABU7KUA0_9ACTN|nr:cell division protein FtsK [Nocardiopsis umidischolae]MEE2052870.1 cell division protein FtsK [Nocardiopsis umidischolae]
MSHPEPHDDRTAGENVVAFPTRPTLGAVPDAEPDRVEHIDPADVEVLDDDADTGPARRVDAQVEQWADQSQWLARVAEGSRTAQPIVPLWMRDRTEAEQVLRWVTSYYAHVAAYQASRSPIYMLRLMGRSPRGAARVLGAWGRWAMDTEANELRRAAAGSSRTSEYMMLSRQHSSRIKARMGTSILLAVATLITAAVAVPAAPAGVVWGGVWAGLSLLGLLGRRPDQPIIDRAVLPTKVEKLTSENVLAALGSLGISEINRALTGKTGEEIGFTAPIIRDGPGWRAEISLPRGVVATDVMERRDKLASGLRRPLGCVWPEPLNEDHPGKLVLWVGDEAMNKAKQAAWPLLTKGSSNLFKPVPFGADQRGRLIDMLLMFEGVLIGAKPRMGKTFALRVLLLAAALDAIAELRIYELKGTGDCGAVEKVAHEYASGPDDGTIEQCLGSMRQLVNVELIKRSQTINRIAKENPQRCPENKVTEELANDKSLGLHPIVFAVDECQELFTHPQHKDEAKALTEKIVKRGPALGIIPIFATQRPDAQSLPTGVSSSIGVRFCLRVMGQSENDMVLGTSAYKNGIRATTFTAKDKGIGYLAGVTDDPMIVRSSYLDAPAAEKISERAYAIRKAASTLSGHAIGQAPEVTDTSTILDHLMAVWPGDADAVWSIRLIDALAAYRPDLYGKWQEIEDEKSRAGQLASALKPFKVTTKQLHRDGANKRGVAREAVEKAANS